MGEDSNLHSGGNAGETDSQGGDSGQAASQGGASAAGPAVAAVFAALLIVAGIAVRQYRRSKGYDVTEMSWDDAEFKDGKPAGAAAGAAGSAAGEEETTAGAGDLDEEAQTPRASLSGTASRTGSTVFSKEIMDELKRLHDGTSL